MGYTLHLGTAIRGLLTTLLLLVCTLACLGQVRVLVDQVGYETQATK